MPPYKSQKSSKLKSKSMERRFRTQVNYSVLTTLMMEFLKNKNLYHRSQALAENNDIGTEKNYSIIFLRMSLYFFDRKNKGQNKFQTAKKLFGKLNDGLQDLVRRKYKQDGEVFIKKALQMMYELTDAIRKIFQEGDLSNYEELSKQVILIYKNNQKEYKDYSITHQKMAVKLAKLIVGVTSQGDSFIRDDLPPKKENNLTLSPTLTALIFQNRMLIEQNVVSSGRSHETSRTTNENQFENSLFPQQQDFLSFNMLEDLDFSFIQDRSFWEFPSEMCLIDPQEPKEREDLLWQGEQPGRNQLAP